VATRTVHGWIGVRAASLLAWLSAWGAVMAQDVTTTTPGSTPVTRIGPPVQPAGQPAAHLPPPGAGEIELSAFSEPVELKAFVEYVADALQINVVGNETLAGTVVFNAPMKIQRADLLPLLDSLLEQHGFTIVKDGTGFYTVQASTSVKVGSGGTTRLIPTPGLRPTALAPMVAAQFAGADVNAARVSYLDDLGVIVITDTPRRIAALESLVAQLVARQAAQQLLRFEVEHLAASVARQRIIELVTAASSSGTGVPAAGQPPPGGAETPGGGAGRLANLPERLTIDAQGNAIIFRGDPAEAGLVERALAVVDVPNMLETRQYFAGRAASAIADVARSRGLGDVQQIQTKGAPSSEGQIPGLQPGQQINPVTGQITTPTATGPTIVVDRSRGLLVYSGTRSQHEQMVSLLAEFNTEAEQIVIRAYKLNDAKAQDVADLVQGLLENRAAGTETGSLLPQQQGLIQGLRGGGRAAVSVTPPGGVPQPAPGEGAGPEGVAFSADEEVFVIADEANNQVLVKAPAKLQPQFEELIKRLDLRRAQVYLEAKIIAVSASDDFRLAFETQLINAGGTGGAVNTNFGLGSFGENGSFTGPKSVGTGLSGLTAALIKSDMVPIIINALQKNVDTRVLATPQLLVDDNELAELASVEVQQTTVTTQTQGNPAQTSVGTPQEAGTKLSVTPHISRGGYVRLEYKIEQSRFLGQSVGGIPADQQRNTLSGDSVTVPQDTTVVVGGLTLSSLSDTIVKIPLLGDIPIIGHLFRDTNKNNRKTTLYVFLTPRILLEPTIQDLTLLTRGPQAELGTSEQLPRLKPSVIEIIPRAIPTPSGPGGRAG
jgi:type II secretory pathway component GspD/PulD (secretin)